MINTIVEPEIVKLLRAEEPLARPANGRSRQRPTCCKIVPLPDPRQFDILQSGPGWRGPSIETARVHHLARRRGCSVAARGARAATGHAGNRVHERWLAR